MTESANSLQFGMVGNAQDPQLLAVSFLNQDLCATNSKDTFYNYKDKVIYNDKNMNLTWTAERKASAEVANWWTDYFKDKESTFDHAPKELNFAMFGRLNLQFKGGPLFPEATWVTIEDVGLAQGHETELFKGVNNWWFAQQGATQGEDSQYPGGAIVVELKDLNILFFRGYGGDDPLDGHYNKPNQVKITFF